MEVLGENEPHPLFPPSEDDDDSLAPIVSEIQILRVENGKKMMVPRTYRGEEMVSLAQLVSEYGGGDYELIARHNGRISSRRKYHLAGPSKPLGDTSEPAPKEVRESRQPQALPIGGEHGMMGLLITMMQGMMQSQAQAAQQSTQMMMAMMASASSSSKETMMMMLESFKSQSAQQQQAQMAQMAMMKELTAARGSGGSDEAFFKGVEFMRHFAAQQVESIKAQAKAGGDGFDWEGIVETVVQGIQGFQAFQEMAKGGAPAVSAPVSEVVQ